VAPTPTRPRAAYVTLRHQTTSPASEWPPLHVVRFSGVALKHGVEVHKIEGIYVRITSREKTVADCFKKVGLDVTLEALREYLRSRKRSMDALNQGEVRKTIEVEVAVDMLYGPLFFRLLVGHAPLTPIFIEHLIREALHGMSSVQMRKTKPRTSLRTGAPE
jgi:Tetracyclin repressor-like, C-terminal domain